MIRQLDPPALAAGMRNDRMTIEYRSPDTLFQAEGAPRRYSKAALKQTKAVIKKFGPRLPLLVKRSGQVLAHYHVVIALRELGYDPLR